MSKIRNLFLFSSLCLSSVAWGGTTTVLFQPGNQAVGPFPANALTVADPAQKTGLRVKLPFPASCGSPALSACSDTALLNQLDGFSVNPRITVCFSDPIDPTSLNSSVFFMAADGSGSPIKINQTIYDPTAKCAYGKPDRVLAQHTRYLLLVTDPLMDADGHKVKPDKAFSDCLKGKDSSSYCSQLSGILGQNNQGNQNGNNQDSLKDRSIGLEDFPNTLLAASLFTTMSATDWLEKARDFVDSRPAVLLGASSFDLEKVSTLTYVPQDNTGKNISLDIPKSVLTGVKTIAFGAYLSPNFINVPTPGFTGVPGTISITPTNQPIQGPTPPGYVPVSFHIFYPNTPEPAAGYPVVIYGHGLSDTQFGAATYFASTMAQQGIATLAIEIQGHGFGPFSFVNVVDTKGKATMVLTPGRGVPLSAGGTYGATDGCIVGGPFAVRDCGRQTAVDLFALVHTLKAQQGLLNIDAANLFFIGQSFGGTYGTLFHAVEPSIRRAVLNVAGGTSVDISRLAVSARPLGIAYLATRNPPLLNVPLGAPPEDYFYDPFNDNYVFRDMPNAVVNTVVGAMPIQAAFEVADWLGMVGDPLAFAPHLKTTPLAGVPAKDTLFQFPYGDLEVPNPVESAVVRAADGLSKTWFFRFDKAAILYPKLLMIMFGGGPLPALPHAYLSNPTIFSDPAEMSTAIATQTQAAKYFQGASNPDPNQFLTGVFTPSMKLFELPTVLPEALNFIQIPRIPKIPK